MDVKKPQLHVIVNFVDFVAFVVGSTESLLRKYKPRYSIGYVTVVCGSIQDYRNPGTVLANFSCRTYRHSIGLQQAVLVGLPKQ